MKAQTVRRVQVIARYQLKEYTDIVCYRILASNGYNEYRTCYSAGRVSCDCKGFQGYGHCYHADEVKRREKGRRDAARAAYLNVALALGWE